MHVPGALAPSWQGRGYGPCSGTVGEGMAFPVRNPGLEWNAATSARSGRGRGWKWGRRSRGQGRGQRAALPPGRATPVSESYCPSYLTLSWTLVPPGGRRGAVLRILGICLFGAGEAGRGTRAQEGAGRPFPRVSFKGSPALPFPPSPSLQPYLHFKSAL